MQACMFQLLFISYHNYSGKVLLAKFICFFREQNVRIVDHHTNAIQNQGGKLKPAEVILTFANEDIGTKNDGKVATVHRGNVSILSHVTQKLHDITAKIMSTKSKKSLSVPC